MAMHEVEVLVAVAPDGQYVVGKDEDACSEAAGSDDLPIACRMVCIKLTVEVPEPMVIEATLPAREGKVTMTVTG